MHSFLERNFPPGYDFRNEIKTVSAAFIAGVVISVIGFCMAFSAEKRLLFVRVGTDLILNESGVMPDFIHILSGRLNILFILAALIFISASAVHYAYYHSGSKSIYLMRRLPNRFELHRRSLLIPFIYALITILSALILLLVYYAAYMSLTPDVCLAPDQWRKVWRVFE